MSVTLFKALADETRLRLLRILLQHEFSVNDLVSVLHMGQSRISRHLRILAEAGLVTSRRDGLWVFYKSQDEGDCADFLAAVSPYINRAPEAALDSQETERILQEKATKTRQFFNTIADTWDDLNKEILGGFNLPAAVCALMPTACNLAVDLGCGTGAVLEQMLGHAEGVIGVDQSSRMLELCRKRLGKQAGARTRVSLRIGELEHLPLRDQEADFASINLVLHHIERPETAIAEARRILSPQGRLVITDFLQHTDETMRTQYGDRWLGFDESRLAFDLRKVGFARTHITRQRVEKGLTLLIITSDVERPAMR